MWIFTKHGFASAVQDRRDHDRLMVRFRDPDDATAYAKALVAANRRWVRTPRIWRDDRADYLWRFVCPKYQWAFLLAELTDELDYANFKSMMHVRCARWTGAELMMIWSTTNEHQRQRDQKRRKKAWAETKPKHFVPDTFSIDDQVLWSDKADDRYEYTTDPAPF